MPFVKHRGVKREYVKVRVELPDPTIKRVLVVETNMPTSDKEHGFDPMEFRTLVDAVREGLKHALADVAEIDKV